MPNYSTMCKSRIGPMAVVWTVPYRDQLRLVPLPHLTSYTHFHPHACRILSTRDTRLYLKQTPHLHLHQPLLSH